MDDAETWRWVWLAIAVAGLAGEILTTGTFFLLPFGLGAGAASIAAFSGAGLGLQWLLFVVVSAVATAAVRPIVKRLDRDVSTDGVGARRWIGMTALVLDDIPGGHDETGLVRVGREEWRAQTASGTPVAAGQHVTVIDVLGTRLVVTIANPGDPR